MTREELITHIIELAKPFTARGSDPLEAVVQILVLHGEQKDSLHRVECDLDNANRQREEKSVNFQAMDRDELIAHIEKEAEAYTPPGVTPLEAAADTVGKYASLKEAAAEMQLEYIQHLFKHRWRPMSEAPKDKIILVRYDVGEVYCCQWIEDDSQWLAISPYDLQYPGKYPDFWQPLPEPPTEEEMEALKDG